MNYNRYQMVKKLKITLELSNFNMLKSKFKLSKLILDVNILVGEKWE